MNISASGLKELKASEAFREFAYPDVASPLYKTYPKARWGFKPASEILETLPGSAKALSGAPWTVGYGQTVDVTPDSQMTEKAAEINLLVKIGKYEDAVERACTITPTQGQFDALVQLAWNVMSAVSPKSSIIKAHNRGDWQAASRAFGLYNKANGRTEKGLTLRRAREGAAYLAASPAANPSLPETMEESGAPSMLLTSSSVDEERPMRKSEINIASTAAGGSAAVAAAAETVNSISAIKSGVSTLADWAVPILLIAVVALCVYIVWQRGLQRKQGWA